MSGKHKDGGNGIGSLPGTLFNAVQFNGGSGGGWLASPLRLI
jgi:hypothetical protein